MPTVDFDIALNYNTASADASLASFRTRAIAGLNDLASKFSKIDLLKGLIGDSAAAVAPLTDAKKKVDELTAALKAAKDSGFVGIGKAIAADLRLASTELKTLEKQSSVTTGKIKELETELKAAGVNTKNLTAEQKALTNALLDAQKAAAAQGSRNALGVTGAVEAKAQVDALNEAFRVLKVSGTASAKEIEVAQVALGQKIREVEASTRAATGTTQGFTTATLAMAASFAVVTANIVGAARAAIDYEQGLARISSITTLSKTQLGELGQETLKLTTRIGIDATTAFKSLYEIISSGIPPDNALAVLEQSAKAAVAGVTDINTASRIGVAVLNSYGQQVGELPRVFDTLFQTVKDGVITFPELSEKLGLVLPAARAAGISLEEVSGSLVVLTRNGLNAPRAVVALEGAIKQLSAPGEEARDAMLELGISFNGLQGTIEQIAKKNLGPDLLRRLIPDVEGQRAVGILARQYDLLSESVSAAKNSAGAAQEAFGKLANTPQQQIEKFSAAMTTLKISIGEALTDKVLESLPGLTRLVEIVVDNTGKANAFTFALDALVGRFDKTAAAAANLIPGLTAVPLTAKNAAPLIAEFGAALEQAGVQSGKASYELNNTSLKFIELGKAAEASAAVAVKAAGEYSKAFGPAATEINLAVSKLNTQIVETEGRLKSFADRLAAVGGASKTLFDVDNQKLAQAYEQALTVIETSVARRELTEAEGFARITALRQQSIAQSLDQLNAYSAAAVAQFDKEAEIRIALARKAGADVQKIEIELRDAKIKLLAEFQAKYASYVGDIATAEKTITENLKGQIDARRGLIEASEKTARDIYRSSLDSFRQRADIQRESEENLSKLRAALAANDTKAANEYYARVVQLSASAVNSLTDDEKKSTTGILVRSDAQRQLNEATRLLKEPLDANIATLGDLNKGYGELKEQAVEASAGVRQELAKVTSSQANEIPVRVEKDTAQITEELNKLETQLAARKPLLEVQLAVDNALKAAEQLKTDIEKKVATYKIAGDFERLKLDAAAAIEALPKVGLKANTEAVDSAIKGIGTSLDTLFTKRRDLDSNVKEVARDLAEINNLKFDEKTLTIRVKYVPENSPQADLGASTQSLGLPGFKLGGEVPSVGRSAIGPFNSATRSHIAHFATGGFVGRVPGTGNTDSVYTQLAPGSFVLRKLAVQALLDSGIDGDRLGGFGRTGDGGRVGGLNRTGSGGIFGRSVSGSVATGSLDQLIAAMSDAPIFDRSEEMTAMFDAAFKMQEKSIAAMRAVFPAGYVEGNAEAFSRSLAQPKVDGVKQDYFKARASQDPTAADAATSRAVTIAQGIATPARGLSLDELQEFASAQSADEAEAKARHAARDLGMSFEDYLRKIDKEQPQDKSKDKNSPPTQRRALGGPISGGQLVDAMVMPGEYVFSPEETQKLTLEALHRLNGVQSPQQVRANLRYFADGGFVGMGTDFAGNVLANIAPAMKALGLDGGRGNTSNSSNTTNSTTINAPITISGGGNLDVRQLARQIRVELQDIDRREGRGRK